MSRKDINLHSILRKVLFCFVFFFSKTHALKLELKICKVQFYRQTRRKATG